MDGAKYYHILYADDVRFSSLAAQIYGKVAENLTEEEQIHDTMTKTTGFDLKLAQHKQGSSKTDLAKTSTHYAIRDALYFDILDYLGINPNQPEIFSSDIIDGDIHVLSGNMAISGSSVINPIVEAIQAVFPHAKKTPSLFGMKNDKDAQKQFLNIKNMIDILPKMPIPTIFRLHTENDAIISGPIDDASSRLDMGNMMLLFKGELPFKWQVIGYLYPAQRYEEQEISSVDFLSSLEKGIGEFSSLFLPQSNAIMFPLLIMR